MDGVKHDAIYLSTDRGQLWLWKTQKMSLDRIISLAETRDMKQRKTSPEIEKVALRLGATRNQIYIWRNRGVSETWKKIIVHASRGRIKIDDFPARDK